MVACQEFGNLGSYQMGQTVFVPVQAVNATGEAVGPDAPTFEVIRDDDATAIMISAGNYNNGVLSLLLDDGIEPLWEGGRNYAVKFSGGSAGFGGADLTNLIFATFDIAKTVQQSNLVQLGNAALDVDQVQLGVKVNGFASGLASTSASQLSVNVLSMVNASSNVSALLSNVSSILTSTAHLPTWPGRGIKKNVGFGPISFPMFSNVDHRSPLSGLTILAERSIDGGAFGSCSNAAAEIGVSGIYALTLANADVNGNATVLLRFSATGADDFWSLLFLTP